MHVYASLQEAKNYATDEGTAWGEGSTNDALALSILESVSRHVDWWARRSRRFGSGFGPRVGVNRYDGPAHVRPAFPPYYHPRSELGATLRFEDDLIETTGDIVVRDSTGSTTVTHPVVETDFYLVNNEGGYDSGPYRKALLHGQGDTTAWPIGLRVIEWPGIWGYSNVTEPLTPTLGDAIDDTATTVPVSNLDGLSPGMTLLVEDEQVYVRALVDADPDFSIIVVRAENGTTAASHADMTPLAHYVYEPRVVEATLRVWFKRWIARNSAADGSDGGGQTGTVWPRESEDTILMREIGDLRLAGRIAFGRSG